MRNGTNVTDLRGIVDTEKLIDDVRRGGNVVPDFKHKFGKMPIDVLSLEEAKSMIEADHSIKNKNHALDIIDHINEQTKYVSHAQRSDMSIDNFLHNHHYSSHQSYSNYASNVLRSKLRTTLGTKEPVLPDIVEWEIGRSRSNPVDLMQDDTVEMREKTEDMIQRIISD
jgi:hypothetical protein